MTLKEFLANYKLEFQEYNLGNETYIIITKLINRSNDEVVKRIKNSIDIFETERMIKDSKMLFSFDNFDWNKIIDKYKRLQVEQFDLLYSIENFYPQNENTDINILTE